MKRIINCYKAPIHPHQYHVTRSEEGIVQAHVQALHAIGRTEVRLRESCRSRFQGPSLLPEDLVQRL